MSVQDYLRNTDGKPVFDDAGKYIDSSHPLNIATALIKHDEEDHMPAENPATCNQELRLWIARREANLEALIFFNQPIKEHLFGINATNPDDIVPFFNAFSSSMHDLPRDRYGPPSPMDKKGIKATVQKRVADVSAIEVPPENPWLTCQGHDGVE